MNQLQASSRYIKLNFLRNLINLEEKIKYKCYNLYKLGSGRAFCSENGWFCLKNKPGIVVKGILDDNEMKEQTFLFPMVPM